MITSPRKIIIRCHTGLHSSLLVLWLQLCIKIYPLAEQLLFNIRVKGRELLFDMEDWVCSWEFSLKHAYVIQIFRVTFTKRRLFNGHRWQALTYACLCLCVSVFVLPRGESAYSSRGHSTGPSVWDVCDGSEEGQHEVRQINAPGLSLPLSEGCHIVTKQCVLVVCFLSVPLQAVGGWWSNSARPCGELRAPRGLVDSASHHHHAPLCRLWRPAGLADPAQEPFSAEPVGGEMREAKPIARMTAVKFWEFAPQSFERCSVMP